MDILLNLNLSFKSKQNIGLKTTCTSTAATLPLIHFTSLIRESIMQFPPDDDLSSSSVVPTHFDSHLSTAVAPDHLLSGLIANVLEACFRSLPDNESRIVVERYILQSAVDNSLPTEGRLLRFSKTTFDGLSSNTMSTLYVVLLFA